MSTKTTANTRRYASVTTAAEYAECEHKLIRKLITSGELKAYRLGARAIRVDLNELDHLMAGDAA